LLPSLKATIEHGHGIVTTPLDHPPQAAAVVGPLAVVDHYLHVVVQPHAAQPLRQHLALWQGVATAIDRIRRVGFAQVVVEVGKHRPGNVLLAKHL
jgi:hypothetical protein